MAQATPDMQHVSSKVIASTVTGFLAFIATILVTHFGFDLSDQVAAWLTAAFTTAGTFAGGYLKKELPDVVVEEALPLLVQEPAPAPAAE